jgi:hypothetical protein
LHARLRVPLSTRHSPRPLLFKGTSFLHTSGAIAPRERGVVSFRHCEERSDEAIQLLLRFGEAGLLRGACHRARIRATRWLAMTALDLNCFGCLKIESEITLATVQPWPLLSSSCPALCRASTSCLRLGKKGVDGRDKPGHDETSARSH